MDSLTLLRPLTTTTGVLDAPSPLLSYLDRLLHPSRRERGHEELRKARVLAGTVALLLVASWPICITVLLERPPASIVAMLLGSLASYHIAFARLRHTTASLGTTAVFACAPLLSIFLFLALHEGGSVYATNPWNIAIGLFFTYFVGARTGLAFAGVLGIELLFSHALTHYGLSLPAMPTGSGRSLVISDVAGLGAIGAIGALYALSRADAHRALDSAHRRAAGSEARLLTLVENTDDLIASLDARGRLVVANAAYRKTFQQLIGREPHEGVEVARLFQGDHAMRWGTHIRRALRGEPVATEESHEVDGVKVHLEFSLSPIPRLGGGFQGLTIFGRDITARKETEAKVQGLNQQLVDLSRQAGMAEVATGILHNVGNTLNSVNVSASLVAETLRRSKSANLAKVAVMLREHASDVAAFLSNDPKGKLVPNYITQLSDALVTEREGLQHELTELTTKVDHIKSVVRLQQEHAKGGGFVEVIPVRDLIESALRLHDESFNRLGIELKSECAEMPPLAVDRHKLLQILVNLLSNARHALIDSGRPDKSLTIRVEQPTPERVRIQVIDNGLGIAPENLPRMFRQGFTTRKEGHGFGLHMSALTAASMGGSLTCESPGNDRGATFTLELPVSAG